MCRPDQKRIYGVARNEAGNNARHFKNRCNSCAFHLIAAEILCEVDSFPPPDVFKWSFNNTAEMIDMPSTDFVKQSLRASKLTYTPTKVGNENDVVKLIVFFTLSQLTLSKSLFVSSLLLV